MEGETSSLGFQVFERIFDEDVPSDHRPFPSQVQPKEEADLETAYQKSNLLSKILNLRLEVLSAQIS